MNDTKYIPPTRNANLSTREMHGAIAKITRRIQDLDELDIEQITERRDPSIYSIETKLHALITSIFKAGTIEYEKYIHNMSIDTGPVRMGRKASVFEIREAVERSVARIKSTLEALKSHFEEELDDAGVSGSTKPLRAYEGLDLHPAIERAAGQLFRNGHYANAIEDAVKALNSLVRLNSGIDDKDGTTLMHHVFSPKNPVLKVNDLTDRSDEDEQQGFMMMFSGAVAGLRNPRAHKLIKDDAEETLEFIAFISLLAKIADKAAR